MSPRPREDLSAHVNEQQTIKVTTEKNEQVKSKDCNNSVDLEEALEQIGVGRYAYLVLLVTCYSTVSASTEPFGIGLLVTSAQCDLHLDTFRKGIIAAVPMLGIIVSSHTWGYIADTRGRRYTMLITLTGSWILGLVSSFVNDWITLTVLKLLSVVFASGASAVVYAFVVEQVPRTSRNKFMMMATTSLMLSQTLIAATGYVTLRQDFTISLSPFPLVYRPWRLLCQAYALLNLVATLLFLLCVHESPKFFLSQGKEKEALEVLARMYAMNTGKKKEEYPVKSITMLEDTNQNRSGSILQSMWHQTAPLFQKNYVKKTMLIIYASVVAFSTTPPLAIWMPHTMNAFMRSPPGKSGEDTFCSRVVTQLQAARNATATAGACDDSVDDDVLHIMMVLSGIVTSISIISTVLLRYTSKRALTIILNAGSAVSCVVINSVSGPPAMLVFLFIATNSTVMGIVSAFAVEIYPTYLRSMAVCLTIMAGRGMSFITINVMGAQIENNCTQFFYGYGAFIFSAALIGFFLPGDQNTKSSDRTDKMAEIGDNKTTIVNIAKCNETDKY